MADEALSPARHSSSFSGPPAWPSPAQRCGWDFRGSQSVSGHSVTQLLGSMMPLLPDSPGCPLSSISLPSGPTHLLHSSSSLFLKHLEPNPLPLLFGHLDGILTVTHNSTKSRTLLKISSFNKCILERWGEGQLTRLGWTCAH